MITTEKNIPIPPRGVHTYLDALEVGDSVCISQPFNKANIKAAVAYRQLDHQKTFTTRTIPEGFRIWRTS